MARTLPSQGRNRSSILLRITIIFVNIYCPVIWISHTSLNFAAFIMSHLASSFNGQDISLSRQRQGFNSPRSRHSPYGLKDRTNQASEATVMLKPISLLIKVNPPLCRKTNIFVELIFRQIICRLSLQVKIVAYHREISALVGRYAGVAEQADARDFNVFHS